jgi:hypothetical protein
VRDSEPARKFSAMLLSRGHIRELPDARRDFGEVEQLGALGVSELAVWMPS